MLELYKDKLKKYKCLEIDGGMVLFATTALKNKIVLEKLIILKYNITIYILINIVFLFLV